MILDLLLLLPLAQFYKAPHLRRAAGASGSNEELSLFG